MRRIFGIIIFMLFAQLLPLVANAQTSSTEFVEKRKQLEDRIRTLMARDFASKPFQDISIRPHAGPTGKVVIYATLISQVSPHDDGSIDRRALNQVARAVMTKIKEAFPGAEKIRMGMDAQIDFEKYESPKKIDLDGVILRLGMSRSAASAAIKGSQWSPMLGGAVSKWSLSTPVSSGPVREARVYFSDKSKDARIVFLVPAKPLR